MKVATVIGTRPEIVRLSRVISALDRHMDHVLIHTGQNYDYELNQVFFDDLEIRQPDHFLEAAADSASATIGYVISRSDEVFSRIKPDAMLVLGDTNSCLAAIAAKRRKIPVFHMEAGNRCFDERVPEEINRRIVDHISDVNLPYSHISREYLLREGLPPDRVIQTGSPMFEVIHYYLPKIRQSTILETLRLRPGEYFVISAHREENVDSPDKMRQLVRILQGLVEKYGFRVIFSTHPRTRKQIASMAVTLPPEIELLIPLGYCDYVHLQMHAKATLSDSGTITEESSILSFPALNIREAHERPEGMEETAVMMVGLEWERVVEGLEILGWDGGAEQRQLRQVTDYLAPNVSQKIVRLIESYTDYVNRVVWRRCSGKSN
jgi:UDP-N-acetyl-L-fucosamine synthase